MIDMGITGADVHNCADAIHANPRLSGDSASAASQTPELMGLSWWGPDGTWYGPDGEYPDDVTVTRRVVGASATPGSGRNHGPW